MMLCLSSAKEALGRDYKKGWESREVQRCALFFFLS